MRICSCRLRSKTHLNSDIWPFVPWGWDIVIICMPANSTGRSTKWVCLAKFVDWAITECHEDNLFKLHLPLLQGRSRLWILCLAIDMHAVWAAAYLRQPYFPQLMSTFSPLHRNAKSHWNICCRFTWTPRTGTAQNGRWRHSREFTRSWLARMLCLSSQFRKLRNLSRMSTCNH